MNLQEEDAHESVPYPLPPPKRRRSDVESALAASSSAPAVATPRRNNSSRSKSSPRPIILLGEFTKFPIACTDPNHQGNLRIIKDRYGFTTAINAML